MSLRFTHLHHQPNDFLTHLKGAQLNLADETDFDMGKHSDLDLNRLGYVGQ